VSVGYRQIQTAPYPARPGSQPFARTLADASLGEIVFQSALSGRVHAPASGARLAIALGFAPALGVLLVVGLGIAPNLVGRYDGDRTWVGCILGAVFIGLGLFLIALTLPLTRAAVLVNTGRFDAAQTLLARWSGARSLQIGNLYGGVLASARGDLPGALERYQKLMAFVGRIGAPGLRGALQMVGVTEVGPWGRRPTTALQPQLIVAWLEAAYHAARILCDLGRVQEATYVLQIAGPPVGEYLVLLRALAERYAEHCSGVSTLSAEQLASLAAWARGLRGSWGLLALAASDYARRGDAATAARLLDEERSRPNAARLAVLMPQLWGWVQQWHP
jgi:hypothetical protein